MSKETRHFKVSELRVETREGESAKIVGHAAVFNDLSVDLGGFREKIDPGFFADAIKTSDVRALFNHDANFVLGRNTSGTLKLEEDERGLAVEITPPDTQLVRDMVLEPMARGDIDQMSFAFDVLDDTWDTVDGENIRTLQKAREIFDVSPVTFPAYPTTDVALRNAPAEIRSRIENRNDTEEVTDPAEPEEAKEPETVEITVTTDELKKRFDLLTSGA